MWLELLADLRRYPPSWNAHLHKALCLWTSATGWMLYQWLEVVNRCHNRSQKMPEIRKQQFRTGGVSTAMFRLSADLLGVGSRKKLPHVFHDRSRENITEMSLARSFPICFFSTAYSLKTYLITLDKTIYLATCPCPHCRRVRIMFMLCSWIKAY